MSSAIRSAVSNALLQHERVVATVRSALIDLSGEIVRQSAARTLTITG